MKRIPLVNSRKRAKVDDEDYPYLSQWRWYLTPEGYAARVDRSSGEPQIVFMHDEVLSRVHGGN